MREPPPSLQSSGDFSGLCGRTFQQDSWPPNSTGSLWESDESWPFLHSKKFFSGIFNILVRQILSPSMEPKLRTLAQISANEENYPLPNVIGATMRNRAMFFESPKVTQRLTASGVSSPSKRGGHALRHSLSYTLSWLMVLMRCPSCFLCP